MIKKILSTLALVLFPFSAFAFTGTWSYSSTSTPQIYPTAVFSVTPSMVAPFIVATTSTSTFYSGSAGSVIGTQISGLGTGASVITAGGLFNSLSNAGPYYDGSLSKGTNNQLLKSSGSATTWINPSFVTSGSTSTNQVAKVSSTLGVFGSVQGTSTATSTFTGSISSPCFFSGGSCLSSSGSTAPGGNNADIQYNNLGAFAGTDNATLDINGDMGLQGTLSAAASQFSVDGSGNVSSGNITASAGDLILDNTGSFGSTDGLYFRNITNDAGLVMEGSQVLSLANNVLQVGTRDTSQAGGIFRLDARTGIGGLFGGEQAFIVFGSPTGTSDFNNIFAASLQTGDIMMNAVGGNTGIGLTTVGTRKLDVNGDVRLRAGLADGTNSLGSSGNCLTSTGTATAWSSSLCSNYFSNTSATTTLSTGTNLVARLGVFGTIAGTSTTGTSTINGPFAVNSTSTMGSLIPAGAYTGNMSTFALGASTTRWANLWTQNINLGTSTWSLTQSPNGRFSIFPQANSTGTEAFTILSNGNVGFGTSTPSATNAIEVNGNAFISGTEFIASTTGTSTITNTLLIKNSLGVGAISSPSQSIETSGDIKASKLRCNSVGSVACFTLATTLNNTPGNAGLGFNLKSGHSAYDTFLTVNSNQALTVDASTSFIGIGSSTPGYNLTASGTIAFANLGSGTNNDAVCRIAATGQLFDSGGLTCALSSIFFKTDIQDMTDKEVLHDMNGLRSITYTSKVDGTKNVGFLAEEVEKVDPRLVDHSKIDQTVDGHFFSKGDPIGVNYGNITAIIVKYDQMNSSQNKSSGPMNWLWVAVALLGTGFIYQQYKLKKLIK